MPKNDRFKNQAQGKRRVFQQQRSGKVDSIFCESTKYKPIFHQKMQKLKLKIKKMDFL